MGALLILRGEGNGAGKGLYEEETRRRWGGCDQDVKSIINKLMEKRKCAPKLLRWLALMTKQSPPPRVSCRRKRENKEGTK